MTQWYAIGLTFVRGGLENEVFSLTLKGERVSFVKVVIYLLLPGSSLFLIISLLSQKRFNELTTVLLASCLVFDSLSIYYIARLNALGYFRTTAIANFFNYPVFFILLIGFLKLNPIVAETVVYTSVFFTFGSLGRFIFLFLSQKKLYQTGQFQNQNVVELEPKLSLILSQGLNYLIFKGDIIIISTATWQEKLIFPDSNEILQYIFMSQFVDIWAGIITSISPIIYKRYIPTNNGRFLTFKVINMVIYSLLLITLFIIYTTVFYYQKIHNLSFEYAFSTIFKSFLMLPINLLTYHLVSSAMYNRLIYSLTVSVFFGGLVYVSSIISTYIIGTNILEHTISLIVPIQLTVFLLVANQSKPFHV